ncbi:hypothetical protein HHK36_018201 [Tetracentron sinense]|uniref:Uncharacterized protein n=1 Tax=Tetracentron sinense TaxID=13715 RepID=A0A834Z441_TETSI|nr:hypothetical protein HHK36_018201 [Tetracentron sinense]
MHLWPSLRIRESFKQAYLKKMEWNLHRMNREESPSTQKLLESERGVNGKGGSDSNIPGFVLLCRELLMILSCCYCCFCCGGDDAKVSPDWAHDPGFEGVFCLIRENGKKLDCNLRIKFSICGQCFVQVNIHAVYIIGQQMFVGDCGHKTDDNEDWDPHDIEERMRKVGKHVLIKKKTDPINWEHVLIKKKTDPINWEQNHADAFSPAIKKWLELQIPTVPTPSSGGGGEEDEETSWGFVSLVMGDDEEG